MMKSRRSFGFVIRVLYKRVLKRIEADLDQLIADLSRPFDEWEKRLFRRARERTVVGRASARR